MKPHNKRNSAVEIVRIAASAIETDTSTQCRIGIDPSIVAEYAEAKSSGAIFPPPDLYGTLTRAWIGDGFHRIAADRKNGLVEIEVRLHAGGQRDALRHALSANDTHGKPRTQADKRKAVALALKSFSKLSSRQVGELCHVSHTFVDSVRAGGNVATSIRTGSDGKKYPAGGNVATPTDGGGFDLSRVETQLRDAFLKLFAKCPVDQRTALGALATEIIREASL